MWKPFVHAKLHFICGYDYLIIKEICIFVMVSNRILHRVAYNIQPGILLTEEIQSWVYLVEKGTMLLTNAWGGVGGSKTTYFLVLICKLACSFFFFCFFCFSPSIALGGMYKILWILIWVWSYMTHILKFHSSGRTIWGW